MITRIRKSMEARDEGFTLIELLVVIIIIGILAAIAIPVFLSQRTKGWNAAAQSDLRNLAVAEEAQNTQNPSVGYVDTAADLSGQGFTASTGVWADITLVGTGPATSYCATAIGGDGQGDTFYVMPDSGGVQALAAGATLPTGCTAPTGPLA